jgi:hypothetical protein
MHTLGKQADKKEYIIVRSRITLHEILAITHKSDLPLLLAPRPATYL